MTDRQADRERVARELRGRLFGAKHLPSDPLAERQAEIDAIVEVLAATEVRVLEEAGKLAVESIKRMIVLYNGKLPYFVLQSSKDQAISNDASVALYTAEQIAQHLRQHAKERQS